MGISATTQRLLRARLGYRATAALTADVGVTYIRGEVQHAAPTFDDNSGDWLLSMAWEGGEVDDDGLLIVPAGYWLVTGHVDWEDPLGAPPVEAMLLVGSGYVGGGRSVDASYVDARDTLSGALKAEVEDRLVLGTNAPSDTSLPAPQTGSVWLTRLGDA